MSKKIPVGILGATGAVGQRFIQLLAGHPHFELTKLYASLNSAGKCYQDAVTWRVPAPLPAEFAQLPVTTADPKDDVALVFSALHKEQAVDLEPSFAKAGKAVVSNASSYRMGEDIPLLIPEINAAHLGLIEVQRQRRGWPGFIITNPNCATVGLALALEPLREAFGIEQVAVVTMQARSGAGYPGPPQEKIGDNVLPWIPGEEEKLEEESNKILGTFKEDTLTFANMTISAACHRVDVSDGHLKAVAIRFTRPPASADELASTFNAFNKKSSLLGLPSAPPKTIIVHAAEDRPQPKLDRLAGGGQSVHVGRIRACPIMHYKMIVLSHNTIRGAAGAALLNAELLYAKGLVPNHEVVEYE